MSDDGSDLFDPTVERSTVLLRRLLLVSARSGVEVPDLEAAHEFPDPTERRNEGVFRPLRSVLEVLAPGAGPFQQQIHRLPVLHMFQLRVDHRAGGSVPDLVPGVHQRVHRHGPIHLDAGQQQRESDVLRPVPDPRQVPLAGAPFRLVLVRRRDGRLQQVLRHHGGLLRRIRLLVPGHQDLRAPVRVPDGEGPRVRLLRKRPFQIAQMVRIHDPMDRTRPIHIETRLIFLAEQA